LTITIFKKRFCGQFCTNDLEIHFHLIGRFKNDSIKQNYQLMRKFAFITWFNNFSIIKKQSIVAIIVGIMAVTELLAFMVPISSLSAIRAFTYGEGRWSKAQKDALYNLALYCFKHDEQNYYDEQHYKAFQNQLKVPLGDHKALIELVQNHPNLAMARHGFIEGGNQPEDIDGMIKLFTMFPKVSFVKKATDIWTEADSVLGEVILVGESLHAEINSESPSEKKIGLLTLEINPLNNRLTELTNQFSETMGEGARWVTNDLYYLFLAITFIFGSYIVFFTIFLNRTVKRELRELYNATSAVTNGNYSVRAKVSSQNEIGVVAGSVNSMTDKLEEQIKRIKSSEEAARQSEKQFKSIFDNTSELIQSIHIADQKILYVNPAWLKTLEYTEEEVKILYLPNIIHPDNKESYNLLFQKIREGKNVDYMSEALISKSGKKIFIEGSIFCNFREGVPYSTQAIFRNITDTKLANEKKARLATIVNYSDDAIISLLLDGTITSWNMAAEKLFGYSEKEIIGKTIFILNRPNDGAEATGLLRDIENGKLVQHYETERRKKDGTLVQVDVSLSPIKDESGKIIGVSKIAHDITERIKKDAEIKQRNYLLNGILENSPATIFLKNAKDLKYEYFSKAGEELLGFKNNEMIGKSDYDFFPKEQADFFTSKDREVIGQKKILEIPEEALDTKNGKRWFHTRKAIINDEAGEPQYLLGVSMDITDRKKSEDKFRGLLESTPDGIVLVDNKGIIQLVNNQVEKIFAYNKGELFGKELEILIPARFKGGHKSHFDGFFSNPRIRLMGDRGQANIFGLRKDGTEVPLEISLGPIETSDGLLVSAVIRDITEQKKAEALAARLADEKIKAQVEKEKVLESVKLKDRFLANMSHEIRTPMNAIIGFSDLLAKRNLGKTENEYVAIVKVAGENLLTIINDILDISKMEAGMMNFEEHPFCLREIIKTIYSIQHLKANEKKLDLSFSIEEDVPDNLFGDPSRLSQIIINLVGNAIKFTNKGKVQMNVKARELGGENVLLEFSIEDTGIGIQKEKMDHIFERFWQADSDISRKYGGTGLGLNIAKQLVELQGGTMSFKSEFNVGSVFTFWIPYKKSEQTQPKPADITEKFDMEELSKLKILLVEDNVLNVKLISSLFSEKNLHVQIAENGSVCIEKLKENDGSTPLKNSFDVILMDIEMPVMNGYDAAKYIRKEMKSNIPIIAMTANAMSGEREKCLSFGMDDYISKPINAKLLFEKMYNLTQRYDLILTT